MFLGELSAIKSFLVAVPYIRPGLMLADGLPLLHARVTGLAAACQIDKEIEQVTQWSDWGHQ